MNYLNYEECIKDCLMAASLCQHCASACLQEPDFTDMKKCIQLDMECAAICYSAAQLMSIGSDKAVDICRICASVCDRCAAECEKHSNEHCKQCAEACKKCAESCRSMVFA